MSNNSLADNGIVVPRALPAPLSPHQRSHRHRHRGHLRLHASYHDRIARHRRKALAQALHPRVHLVGRPEVEDVVLKVAQALCELSGSDQPLIARRLRGGAPREDDWARTPVQPTILCSTVDQVGSRLLFRGYGVSDAMKPIHAGLLGSDCLILLDEAHLSEPFRQTLDAIKSLRAPDAAPFGFAVLTATPNVKADLPFGLGAADHSDRILFARIAASKPVRLVDISGKQGVDTEAGRAEKIAENAKAALERLQASGIAQPAVGVVVNRVARARAVFERLEAELKDAAKIMLLIGPARDVNRDELAEELEPIRTGRDEARGKLDQPFIVVATQTIEAGVDIDFDGLITEAAAFDALRQRFGRLNRAGRNFRPEAAILAHKQDIGTKADDPVYGDRIRLTWEKLQQLATEGGGTVDFGIEALRKRIDLDEASELAAPTSDAPSLMPAYAHLWSQTWPIPNADPEVALFLHGPDRLRAAVQVVWRADIDEQHDLQPAMGEEVEARAERARLIELLKLVPPRAAEAIEVPLWAARAWLEQKNTNQADFSDTVERGPEPDDARGTARRAFRWAGEDSELTGVIYASALRSGDLIVVPADYGGCDEWGWSPKSIKRVTDVADAALWPYRGRRFAVRVTPELVAQSVAQRQQIAEVGAPINLDAISTQMARLLTEHESDRAGSLLDEVLRWCETTHEGLGQGGDLVVPHSQLLADAETRRGLLALAPQDG
jgi:CRISPR-associated endonuclease/helicase Cas3